jgi:3-oxoacyl-[acyl-carrier protein] reductase
VNITSVVGVTGNPGQSNYAASKSGLIGMSKCIASEVASRGITVNCIAPGFITSAMTDKLNSDQKLRILENIPMKKMGNANDIAATTKFLVSEDANYVTGQTIHVNGGLAMI